MKPLYDEKEYNNARGKDLLPFECYGCKKTFYKTKSIVKYSMKPQRVNGYSIKYCSRSCQKDRDKYKTFFLKCSNCKAPLKRIISTIEKSGRVFCNKSCSAIYNNTHKTKGFRRSKMEIWIEENLKSIYPNIEILFNDKTAINSELDIYIPSLSLAVELNGIFHYEPIFGKEKLKQIQCNDQNKFYLCQQKGINLCIIDISMIVHFKPIKAQKFLDIICNLINSLGADGNDPST